VEESESRGRGLRTAGGLGLGLIAELLLVAAVNMALVAVIWWTFFHDSAAVVPPSAEAPGDLIMTPGSQPPAEAADDGQGSIY